MARSVPPPRRVHFPRAKVSQHPAHLVSQNLGTTREFSWLAPFSGSIDTAALHVGVFEGAAVATLYVDGVKAGECPLMSGPTEIPGSVRVSQWQQFRISFDRELPEVNVSFVLRTSQ